MMANLSVPLSPFEMIALRRTFYQKKRVSTSKLINILIFEVKCRFSLLYSSIIVLG